jgi:DNA-binding CsgD family transcriptional regulator
MVDQLLGLFGDLGRVVIDPTYWSDLIDRIANLVGAECGALLQSGVRTSDVLISKSGQEAFGEYFRNGWHTRDVRAERGVPLLKKGIRSITDSDLFTSEEIKKSAMHNELLTPLGLSDFVAVGIWAGSDLWGLSFQRGTSAGEFKPAERRALEQLAPRLSNAATLSAVLGGVVVSASLDALESIGRPAACFDYHGKLLSSNHLAVALFEGEPDLTVRHNRLIVRDPQAARDIEDGIRYFGEAVPAVSKSNRIAARSSTGPPIVVTIIPVPGAAANCFLGGRAILLFDRMSSRELVSTAALSELFGLTHAEGRVAQAIMAGFSIEEAAARLGVSPSTVRNQLKSVFSKTDTHKQAQLVALLLGVR